MPGLMRANFRRLEGQDPGAPSLVSIVSSMPTSEATLIPGVKVANAMVKAPRRGARKKKGNDAPLRTKFGATWGEETFEIPHGEMDWSVSALSSEWEPDWVSEEPTPPEETKEHKCLKPGPSLRAVVAEPTCVD